MQRRRGPGANIFDAQCQRTEFKPRFGPPSLSSLIVPSGTEPDVKLNSIQYYFAYSIVHLFQCSAFYTLLSLLSRSFYVRHIVLSVKCDTRNVYLRKLQAFLSQNYKKISSGLRMINTAASKFYLYRNRKIQRTTDLLDHLSY